MKAALSNDAVAKDGNILLRDGFIPCYIDAGNMPLINELFSLTVLTLDRANTVLNDPKAVSSWRDTTAMYLEGRVGVDLKPLAKQLRAITYQKRAEPVSPAQPAVH